MLSYRHAFHAGNHADVLKHVALIECLRLLSRKEKGFLAVDTHAGAGAYALTEGYAAQNAEWGAGITRVRASAVGNVPSAIAAYLKFLDDFAAAEGAGTDAVYPGSPEIIARSLRPPDRAVFCELHPTDGESLAARYAGDGAVRVRRENGFKALRSLLPPPTRRGLVLIDPSYELAEDYELVLGALADSLRRFATGTYILWYPLLSRVEARTLPDRLADIPDVPRLNAVLRVKSSAPDERGMAGSGLWILNPPYTLNESLRECLPFLASALGDRDGGADWSLEAADR